MSRIVIELSEALEKSVQDRAFASGFDSVEAYVRELLEEDASDVDVGAPEGMTVDHPADVVALLKSRDESDSFEPDDGFYDQLRDYARGLRKPKGGQ